MQYPERRKKKVKVTCRWEDSEEWLDQRLARPQKFLWAAPTRQRQRQGRCCCPTYRRLALILCCNLDGHPSRYLATVRHIFRDIEAVTTIYISRIFPGISGLYLVHF